MENLKMPLALLTTLLSLNLGVAHASLQIRAGGAMLYDTERNITWVSDANLFRTQAAINPNLINSIIANVGTVNDALGPHTLTTADFSDSGAMSWWGAQAWVAQLNYGGVSDWRLSTIKDTGTLGCNESNGGTDCGYNVDTSISELAHMYFDNLGLKSYLSPSGEIQPDYGIFGNGTPSWGTGSGNLQNNVGPVANLQHAYWLPAENSLAFTNRAWFFYTDSGYQGDLNGKGNPFYAWAVRDGDIATVPLPAAALLFGSGFLGMLGIKTHGRRKILP